MAAISAASISLPLRLRIEDVELARRAMAAGHLRISRTAAIPVLTSPRPFNRVPHGFSGYLRDLAPAVALAQ